MSQNFVDFSLELWNYFFQLQLEPHLDYLRIMEMTMEFILQSLFSPNQTDTTVPIEDFCPSRTSGHTSSV